MKVVLATRGSYGIMKSGVVVTGLTDLLLELMLCLHAETHPDTLSWRVCCCCPLSTDDEGFTVILNTFQTKL